MLVYHGSYCEIVNPDIKYSTQLSQLKNNHTSLIF